MESKMSMDEMLEKYEKIVTPITWIYNIHETYKYLNLIAAGYGYIHAISYVDSLLRNAGVGVFQKSNAWPLIWPAMTGAYTFNLNELGDCLKSIIFYYHKSGKSRLAKVIPKDYFDDFSIDSTLKPDDLSSMYYKLYKPVSPDNYGWVPRQLFPQIVENHSKLFETPITEDSEQFFNLKCIISSEIALHGNELYVCVKDKPKKNSSGWIFLGKRDVEKESYQPGELIECPLAFIRAYENNIDSILLSEKRKDSEYYRNDNGEFVRKE